MHPAPESVRLLRLAGLTAWGLVGVHAVVQGIGRPAAFGVWLTGFLAFGLLFAWSTRRRATPGLASTLGLAGQSVCVIAATAVQCRGYEGTLLVLVAMQLGLLTTRARGLICVALQTLLLTLAIAHHWSPRQALLLAPPYLGFQVLGLLAFELVARETRARIALTQTNAELVSTRALLAQSAGQYERLRIGRELHDLMGHHLAALSLNLEAVEPLSPPLETARALTHRLLDDVEAVVTTLGGGRIDLEQALRALAEAIPRPRIHVDAAGLALDEPERAHALLRCCQEIVTNAVKHAAAANLWISIRRRADVFELTAHDDGAGARRTDGGHGLPGLRRRLAEMGGTLELDTQAGAGFRVRATLRAAAGFTPAAERGGVGGDGAVPPSSTRLPCTGPRGALDDAT